MLVHDDPRRTAPPYWAPGEAEPIETPESEAVDRIMQAIWSNGFAYGRHYLALVDELIDSLETELTDDLLDADTYQLACLLRANINNPRLRQRCADIANDAR